MYRLYAIGIILMSVVVSALLMGFPIKWLWNWLMPEIFGLPVITFWQACGLSILSAAFFRTSNQNNKKGDNNED